MVASIDLIKTGEKIRDYRKKAGIRVATLAEMLFVDPMAIYKWQRGTNLPSIENLFTIAKIFNVSVYDIICFKDNGEKAA